jgi:predicted small secreted protein
LNELNTLVMLVRMYVMKKIIAPFVLVAALAAGCATGPGPSEASADVRAFAMALRDRDMAGIEARIDRPALQGQVNGLARAIAAEEIAKRTGGGGTGSLLGLFGADLAGPIIERIASRALQPDVLADLARRAGLTPETRLPGRTLTAFALRSIPDGRVCAPDPQTRGCLLYFGKYPSGWKLNAIDEVALRARLAPAPAAPRR